MAHWEAPPTQPSTPAPLGSEARYSDAHVDRVILLPTAETHPKGTVTLSSYEFVFLQAGYAISDRVQVSLTFLPPLEREPIVFADASLKGVIVRDKRVRVAATASATGIFGLEQGEGAVGRLGGVTQLCFDDACRSSASAAANWILVGPAMLLLNGVGFVARTSDLIALLFEFQSLVPLGREAAQAHGIAGAIGVRFSGPRWAIDVALDAPVGPTGNLPGALPILAGTYRF